MPKNSPTLDEINAAIDTWFLECLSGPPISHHVECYNRAHDARAELKARLAALLTGDAPQPAEPAKVPRQGEAAAGDEAK